MKTLTNYLFGFIALFILILGSTSCNNGGGKKVTQQLAADTVRKDRVWMTVDIGSLREYSDVKLDKGINHELAIRGYARDTVWISRVGNNIFRTQPMSLDLVVRSVKDLGFESPVSFRALCFRAMQQGLDLCPPEVAPYILLKSSGLSFNDQLHIAMEPLLRSRSTKGFDSDFTDQQFRFSLVPYRADLTQEKSPMIVHLQMAGYSEDRFFYPDEKFVFVSAVHANEKP